MHLSKLPSGKWIATVKVNGHRKAVTAATKNAARQAGRELEYELGATPRAAELTVIELIDAWTAQAVHSVTYSANCQMVIDKMPATFAARQVTTLTRPIIDAFYRQLLKDGWTAHRVHRMHDVLSGACSLAVEYGWLTVSPSKGARLPAIAKAKVNPPTTEQVWKLIDAADGTLLLYVLLSAALGARRGEMVALQWPDITGQSVYVSRSRAYTPKSGVVTTEGKTGPKGHRPVAIDVFLADELQAHRVAQVALALGAGLPSPLWIFSSDAGVTPWRPDFATYQFIKPRRKCGITGVRLHDLRHYVATQLLAAGVPLKTVGDRLGHRQLSTTSDRYGAYVPAADQAAAEVMAGLRVRKLG